MMMNAKNMANKVLLAVFLLFLLANGLKYFYKDSLLVEIFYAVMEAALVGGIADWFAITAIFKKPLGFPWHTALIPRHRKRLIGAIQGIVDQDLLTVESIKKRVATTCFVDLFISFIDNKEGKLWLENWLKKSCREIINNLDIPYIVDHFDNFIRKEIRNIDITYQIRNLISWLLKEGKVQVITIYIVDELINQIEKNEIKDNVYQYIEDLAQTSKRPLLERVFIWLGEQTNSISISDAAIAFHGEIVAMLHEIKKPEHTLHQWINETLIEIMEQPEMNFAWMDQIEGWKMTLVTDVELGKTATDIAEDFIATTNPIFYDEFIDWIASQTHGYWEFFKKDHEIKEWLEVRIKKVVYQFIEKEHYVIGEMVQRVLNEFTDDKLNDFVEEKAGDDFQWIRINGSVVGGIVGLMVFLFLHYFYDDYVVPIIQGWL